MVKRRSQLLRPSGGSNDVRCGELERQQGETEDGELGYTCLFLLHSLSHLFFSDKET